MRPADLTTELADLLSQMYEADRGNPEDAPAHSSAPSWRCHEEARASAWEPRSAELNPVDWAAAQYWLDVKFFEPCSEQEWP